MKILLINPPSKEAKKGYSSAIFPPLGLLYIASVLREGGHSVKVLDLFVLFAKKNYNFEKLKAEIIDFKPNIVGVSFFSSNIVYVRNILDIVKEISPKIVTVVGGPHITAVPNYLINLKSADFGVYAEGEFTFLEFVNKLSKQKNITNIKGIIYKKKDKIEFKVRPYITDLDVLPFPARDLVPMDLYQPSTASYRQLPATAIITSRGCPFQCLFCHKPIFGNKFRPHSAKRVIEEIETLNKKFGIKDFKIYDDTFTLNRVRVVEICNLLIKKNLGITWNCTTRVDTVDYELLKLMKKAGCYNISFGVEAGSERILKLIKKGITKMQVINVFKWVRELGIESVAFFIIGLPTQTKQEIFETIKFAKQINPDYVQFTLVNPHPDTELYELCKKYGKVAINDWSNFSTYLDIEKELPFVPYTLSERELKRLYRKAYFMFYFRLGYILYMIRKLSKSDKPLNRISRGIKTILDRT
ncbi:MAG: radical SAM protein [archaeon]